MDKKPNVFPNAKQTASRNDDKAKLEAYEAEKSMVTNEIYTPPSDISYEQMDAMEAMRLRTMDQMAQREKNGRVVDPSLAEKSSKVVYDNQIALRDEQLEKNKEQTRNYQRLSEEASNRHKNIEPVKPMQETTNNYNQRPPIVPPTSYDNVSYADSEENKHKRYIDSISQPNYNCSFDVIPLPSQGKLYPNKKPNIRIGYMTTADENILTSPNLLQSGEFLEILINRKILEPDLRYSDLHVGDRNAIMLWLRATAYGEMYPITIGDEDGSPFDSDVNLNELKTKNLGAEPDFNGLFDFELPLAKTMVKIKLLTCGDIDAIEKRVQADVERGNLVDDSSIYTLQRAIVEVDGETDRRVINDFVSSIRIYDAKALTNYIEQIESGIDLNINVTTPRGGSIATFLPLNLGFFWPNFKL